MKNSAGFKIAVEQFLGMAWADVYVLNHNNEMVEVKQGVELEESFQIIDQFKENYNINNATHIIYDSNEKEVSRRDIVI